MIGPLLVFVRLLRVRRNGKVAMLERREPVSASEARLELSPLDPPLSRVLVVCLRSMLVTMVNIDQKHSDSPYLVTLEIGTGGRQDINGVDNDDIYHRLAREGMVGA